MIDQEDIRWFLKAYADLGDVVDQIGGLAVMEYLREEEPALYEELRAAVFYLEFLNSPVALEEQEEEDDDE